MMEDSKEIPWGVLLLFGVVLPWLQVSLRPVFPVGLTSNYRYLKDELYYYCSCIYRCCIVPHRNYIEHGNSYNDSSGGSFISNCIKHSPICTDGTVCDGCKPRVYASNWNTAERYYIGTGKIRILQIVKNGFWINMIVVVPIVLSVYFILPVLWDINLQEILDGIQ